MFKAALAFIPLLSGYLFVTTWFRTSYQIKRDNSQKIYFRAAFWGLWLFALSFGIATFFRSELQPFLKFMNLWREQIILTDGEALQVNLIFWLLCLGGTLLLGMIAGFILNWITALFSTPLAFYYFLFKDRKLSFSEKAKLFWYKPYQNAKMSEVKKAIHGFNSEIEIILFRALELGMPVSITTVGKVYVGYVVGSIEAEPKRESLRVLPVISGYRSKDTMKVTFTTFYDSVYQQFNANPKLKHLHPILFELVIPESEIKSINLFDVKAYLEFQKAESTGNPNQLELLNPL